MLSSRVFDLNGNIDLPANQPDDLPDSILRLWGGVAPQAVSRLSIRRAPQPFPGKVADGNPRQQSHGHACFLCEAVSDSARISHMTGLRSYGFRRRR